MNRSAAFDHPFSSRCDIPQQDHKKYGRAIGNSRTRQASRMQTYDMPGAASIRNRCGRTNAASRAMNDQKKARCPMLTGSHFDDDAMTTHCMRCIPACGRRR
ncbi:hypothetical protein [Burkholderia pyrrocinia]